MINNFESFMWNPVYKLVVELKNKVLYKMGAISYDVEIVTNEFGGKKKLTCVESWANLLGEQKYIDMLQPLEINQDNNLVLFRYANHTGVKNGEEEITSFDNNFWELYDGFYRECRSVVIDVVNLKIVIAPFKKFMNLNQNDELDFIRIFVQDSANEWKVIDDLKTNDIKLSSEIYGANFWKNFSKEIKSLISIDLEIALKTFKILFACSFVIFNSKGCESIE